MHLADTCRDIHRELELLEWSLNLGDHSSQKSPLLFHRWEHSPTSYWYASYDEVNPTAKEQNNPQSATRSFYNINTSYWMPDRPDLQSIIAHEIAHTHIDGLLESLSPLALSKNHCEFGRFLQLCRQAIEFFHRYDDTPDVANRLWHELTADLLATSLLAPRYLYAQFLELLGSGIADLTMHPFRDDFYDLDLLALIDQESINDEYINGEWYCRLMVSAYWLARIYPDEAKIPAHKLVHRLISSVQILCDDVRNYLEARSNPKVLHTMLFWHELTQRLCRIIDEFNPVTDAVKEWITDRANDQYQQTDKKTKDGPHYFPHCSRRLQVSFRNLLVEQFRDEILCRCNNDPIKYALHCKIYGDGVDGLASMQPISEIKTDELYCPSLFARLTDIPWQYAFLRALDFVHPDNQLIRLDKAQTQSWLNALHYDTHMGRDLYLVGLELYLSSNATTSQRLGESAGWAKSWLKTLLDLNKSLENTGNDNKDAKIVIAVMQIWLDPGGMENILSGLSLSFSDLNYFVKQKLIPSEIRNCNSPNICEITNVVKQIVELELSYPKCHHTDEKYEEYSGQWHFLAVTYGVENLLLWNNSLLYKDKTVYETLGKQGVFIDKANHYYKYRYSFLQRRLSRIQGFKLHSLKQILHGSVEVLGKYTDIANVNDSVSNLIGMAVEMVEYLCHRYVVVDNVNKSAAAKSSETIVPFYKKRSEINRGAAASLLTLIRRCCVAGNYSLDFLFSDSDNILMRTKPHSVFSPDKINSNSGYSWSYNVPVYFDDWSEEYTYLIGRHDAISFAPDAPLSRCWMPDIPKGSNDKHEKGYISFFERREVAFRLDKRLLEKQFGYGIKDEMLPSPHKQPLALLSVSVRQTTTRLDFIVRLFRALRGDYKLDVGSNSEPKFLRDLYGRIPNADLDFYLCDGLDDILVVFLDVCDSNHGCNDKCSDRRYSRLIKIFQFQGVLYEDFQVGKTELMLTPACVDAVMKCYDMGDFTLDIQARLLEDRFLNQKNDEFNQRAKRLEEALGLENIDMTVSRTPGLQDFLISFRKIEGKEKKAVINGDYAKLSFTLYENCHLDRIQTSIGLITKPGS